MKTKIVSGAIFVTACLLSMQIQAMDVCKGVQVGQCQMVGGKCPNYVANGRITISGSGYSNCKNVNGTCQAGGGCLKN